MTKFTKILLLTLAVFAVGIFLGSVDVMAAPSTRQVFETTRDMCQAAAQNIADLAILKWDNGGGGGEINEGVMQLIADTCVKGGAETQGRMHCAVDQTDCSKLVECFTLNYDGTLSNPTIFTCAE